MAKAIKVTVTITRIDMTSFYIHGTGNGGTFMLRPINLSVMDKALLCLGKECKITVKDTMIQKVKPLEKKALPK